MRSAIRLLGAALVLAGCAAASRQLSFDVLADGQFAPRRVTTVALLVGADDAGRAVIRDATSATVPRGEIGIAVLAGERPTGGYAAHVQRVTVAGASVDVRVLVLTPPPGSLVTQVVTAPFTVIGVRSADLPSGVVHFTLTDESGAPLASVDASVP